MKIPLDYNNPRERNLFYQSKEWRTLREYILDKNPLCTECSKNNLIVPAEEVDHIVPLIEDPLRRLDPSNLNPLCKKCHSKKTYLESLHKYNMSWKLKDKIWKL